MSDVRERLKKALTTLHEKPLDYPAWGLTGALLREFTARERQYANDAVQTEAGTADPDQILFRAMLLQRCITDPETGQPYSDGRLGIDPRTRTPIFTLDDIQEIADGRAILFNRLWDDLLALAAAAPESLFPGDPANERGERDAGASATGTQETPGEDAPEGSRNPDGGE